MACEAHPIPIRLGEERPFYGSATAASGETLTVQGTSTVTLYDAAGSAAGGINAISVTGQESGAQSELLAWYVLKPSNPPSGTALTPGVYEMVFTMTALGSDNITRVFKPSIMIVVKAASDD